MRWGRRRASRPGWAASHTRGRAEPRRDRCGWECPRPRDGWSASRPARWPRCRRARGTVGRVAVRTPAVARTPHGCWCGAGNRGSGRLAGLERPPPAAFCSMWPASSAAPAMWVRVQAPNPPRRCCEVSDIDRPSTPEVDHSRSPRLFLARHPHLAPLDHSPAPDPRWAQREERGAGR